MFLSNFECNWTRHGYIVTSTHYLASKSSSNAIISESNRDCRFDKIATRVLENQNIATGGGKSVENNKENEKKGLDKLYNF